MQLGEYEERRPSLSFVVFHNIYLEKMGYDNEGNGFDNRPPNWK